MRPINITDLNNAKLDVEHIAELATSVALTSTDRLGQVKLTMTGVRASITDDGVMGKATQALLSADLGHAQDTVAYVTNDPVPEKNGIYRKVGVAGAGEWVQSSGDRTSLSEGRIARITDKTDQITTGKNLFNAATISPLGQWVNYISGAYEAYPSNQYIASFHYSKPIPVRPLTRYTRLHGADGTAFFDANMIFISGSSATSFTTPADAAYAVISILDANVANEQLELGDLQTKYEVFRAKFAGPEIGIISNDMLFDNLAIVRRSAFAEPNMNLYNCGSVSPVGNWINYISGSVQAYPAQSAIANIRYSAPIPVMANTSYVRQYPGDPVIGSIGTLFFDAQMRFISSTLLEVFTTPANAAFVVLNISNDYYLVEQLELGRIPSAVRPYAGEYPQSARPVAGKNLFDIRSISQKDMWVNYVNGERQAYPYTSEYVQNYHYSAPIPVAGNTAYTRLFGQYGAAFFDAKMNFISGTMASNFTTPPDTAYVILNTHVENMHEQLELGNYQTTYVAYDAVNPDRFMLNLPPILYGVVGRELNVYLDNLMIDRAEKYDIDVECAIGGQEAARWTVVPAAPISTNLSIKVYKDADDVLDVLTKDACTLSVVAANAGAGLSKKYMQIGDSTTFAMMAFGYVMSNFAGDALTLTQVGTQGAGANVHEGYPGKDTNFIFTDPASPFVYGGVFNFSQYMTTRGFAGVDLVGLCMGINDMYGMSSDAAALSRIATEMSRYESIINSIHAYNPNIKVGVILPIPPNGSQDSFGADGPNAQTRFRQKRNMMLWVRQCIKQFKNRQGSNVYVVPYSSSLDTLNNFPFQTGNINARNTKQINRLANALHPDYYGYWQMADSIYAWVKNVV
jgi:lysophospholipase L1-like esterase